jgi:glutaredoxin
MIRKLTEAECRFALEHGEFEASLTAGPAAAIILTQSWCPQWKAMKAYLPEVEKQAASAFPPEVAIYYAEYDIEAWKELAREEFITFKEDTYNNREIPYVRYYRQGNFFQDSNYIALDGFLSRLGAKGRAV